MNLSLELIKKAMSCKSVEELLALAKAENISMTKEEAETYFAQLSSKELTPKDIEAIFGGSFSDTCVGYCFDGHLFTP